MIWIAVAGIMAIVGSILMLKPSARDSRLSKLRFEAVRQGMQLKQFGWEPDPKKTGIHDTVTATSYTILRPGSSKVGELRFSLVAQKGWDTEHLPEGLSWHKQGTAKDAEKVKQLLPQLQDELLVLEVWDNKVLLMAKENPTANAQAYKVFLEGFLSEG